MWLPLGFLLWLAAPPSIGEVRPMSNAEVCGRCHRAIFAAWKQSAHAQAMESTLFQDALDSAEKEFGVAARKTCLSCHSPISQYSGDSALVQKVSWEGVTCDYCHSMRSVAMDGGNPKARVEFSLVKSGPLKGADSLAHGVTFSSVHVTSEVCAPCHEYRNPLGLPVLTTYSEWKASRYFKEGRNCQSCHMSRVAGDVVDPRVQRTQETKINLHYMPGGHSVDQLLRSVKARMDVARQPDQLKVTVNIANQAAGHYVPTGSPMRKLILEVTADIGDGPRLREERVYQRVVAGRNGAVVQREPAVFVTAAKVVSDTRLAPDESRTEQFSFPIRPGVRATVKVSLWYYYSPMAETESQQRVTFWTLSKIVY